MVVVVYRRFGTTYPKTYERTLRNNPEEQRLHLDRDGSL